jgi:hypothetical protein
LAETCRELAVTLAAGTVHRRRTLRHGEERIDNISGLFRPRQHVVFLGGPGVPYEEWPPPAALAPWFAFYEAQGDLRQLQLHVLTRRYCIAVANPL